VRFAWNGLEAAGNLRKHGVSFDEAASVFFYPLSATGVTRIIRSKRDRDCMKKPKKLAADELRPEYKRSVFKALVRGKYVGRLQASSNVVVLDPELADLFPNAAAVNAALRSLAEIARRVGSPRQRSR